MWSSRRFLLAWLCLGFTETAVAWADSPHPDFYVEDPYAPHTTSGTTARLGTVVGYLYGEPASILAVGASAAIGHRFGRFALEAEYTLLDFEAESTVMTPIGPGDGDISVGHGHRLGVIARYDVLRLDSHVVGPNSMAAIYVEGGAASAWNHWTRPGATEPGRLVPDDTHRVEGQAGFGIMIDHRLQEPIGFPHRVAWFLGWRVAMSPHQPMSASVCRGVCRPATMTDDGSLVDRSLLFQSSLSFTF
jgi:hypothetical protein